MDAMAIQAFGGVEQLKLMHLPNPQPHDDEVQIEVHCAGVNPVDWKIREGYLKDAFPYEFPIVPGWDAAGTVSALGQNVKDFKIGDRVFAYCRKPKIQWGTYAQYVTMDAAAVAPMPKNFKFAQAAAIPLTGLTSWQALYETAHLKTGQHVLIHGGAGGIGSLAIQLARHVGATVYTTASEHNHGYVEHLGAHHAIDYTAENFVDAIKRLRPAGVDAVLDTIGGKVQLLSYEVIKPGGVLVSIIDPPEAEVAAKFKVRPGYVFVSPNGAQLRNIAGLIEAGAVKAPKLKELPLKEAAAAQEQSRGRHVTGKIVLRVKK